MSKKADRLAALERVAEVAAKHPFGAECGLHDDCQHMVEYETELRSAIEALDHPAPIETEAERKGDEVESAEAFALLMSEHASAWDEMTVLKLVRERDAAIRAATIRECAEVCDDERELATHYAPDEHYEVILQMLASLKSQILALLEKP